MNYAHWIRRFFLLVPGLLMPHTGSGEIAGGVMVFAVDSNAPNMSPPSTIAYLNETESQTYGTNDLVVFSGYYKAGIHTVEVSTSQHGYLLRQSPTDPNAVNDPYSDYGNPRYIELSAATNYIPVCFRFDPVITASAVVRDAWTMERLENAAITFLFDAQSGGKIATTKYPSIATYATNWYTSIDGNFPSNTILYLDDYDLEITKPDYHSFSSNNIITSASPGDSFNLGTIFLYPIDNNNNQIADAWETRYFGANATVSGDEDADGDGMSNRDEYIAGTDPTNWDSCLWAESSTDTNAFTLAWITEPDRTYCISGTTNLLSGEWVQVGGPWEASSRTYMSWTEANIDLSEHNSYRIEVVPYGWQGTNQVLINAINTPDYSANGYTTSDPENLPPMPDDFEEPDS